MSIRITCIKRATAHSDNPYLAFDAFVWQEDDTLVTGHYSRTDLYHWLVNGGHAYIVSAEGRKTYLIAVQDDQGTRYVRSTEDNMADDDLLSVPDCEA